MAKNEKRQSRIPRIIVIMIIIGIIFNHKGGNVQSHEDNSSEFNLMSWIHSLYRDRTSTSIFPEDMLVINSGDDWDVMELELEEALSRKESDVCIVGWTIDRDDLFSLPYSSFWVTGVSSHIESAEDPDTGDTVFYTIHHFDYEDMTEDEIIIGKEEIDCAADMIINRIPYDADTWTSIKVIHDELCKLITYDQGKSLPHIYDAYGALINHEAVCNGYTCAFNHIMQRAGFYSRRVYSEDHAWNMTAIPGNDEYIDVTWDDMDLKDAYGNEYIDHSYMFLSYEEMESVPEHESKSGEPCIESYVAESYNYYAHEGYLITYFNWDDLGNKFKRQYDTGSNMLSVRFSSQGEYDQMKKWAEGDHKEMHKLLNDMGYKNGRYIYWFNDYVRTFSIGLYPPEENAA